MSKQKKLKLTWKEKKSELTTNREKSQRKPKLQEKSPYINQHCDDSLHRLSNFKPLSLSLSLTDKGAKERAFKFSGIWKKKTAFV